MGCQFALTCMNNNDKNELKIYDALCWNKYNLFIFKKKKNHLELYFNICILIQDSKIKMLTQIEQYLGIYKNGNKHVKNDKREITTTV